MFTYENYGLVLSLADCGVEAFLGAVNEVYGKGITDISEFDDAMIMGTYESPDNIYSAKISDHDVDFSDGIVITELPPSVYDTEVFDQIDAVMRLLGYEGWQDDDEFVGNYLVECVQ